jgi:hypothetical protein
MKSILVDNEVYDKLGQIAKPFVETTPNQVLRRLLGLRSTNKDDFEKERNREKNIPPYHYDSEIGELRSSTIHVHPAFLTFLVDKYLNSHGNFGTSDIPAALERFNLKLNSGAYRNPWMKSPYKGEKNGLISCIRTIEHFRQTRKFACWLGRNTKLDCNENYACKYHPDNSYQIRNKCDLRKGAIWKRKDSNSPFSYGSNYIDVVEKELLGGKGILLKPLLRLLYPREEFGQYLIQVFQRDFNMRDEEMTFFIST